MADGEMTSLSPAVVHQALHGYSEGHRLLASSCSLTAKDAKVLLRLSDAAASGLRTDGDAYLTGYPLADSGYYALAKTWPATELPRPGCVWTHTILVDFQTLGEIPDLSQLRSFFARPLGDDRRKYQVPLSLRETAHTHSVGDLDQSVSQVVFSALYGKPASKIVHEASGGEIDELVTFGVWSQQWPRLRRDFRFCTSTAADRSIAGHEFDLQFMRGGAGARNRFAKCVQAADVTGFSHTAWLAHGYQDLLRPDAVGLRSFFSKIGEFLDSGRRGFAQLVQFHLFILDADNPEATKNAINFLSNHLKSVNSAPLRVAVATRGISQLDDLGDEAFDFILQNLPSVEGLTQLDSTRVGQRLLERSTSDFVHLPDVAGIGEAIVNETLKVLSMDRLQSLVGSQPAITERVLTVRPDVATTTQFWHFGGSAELTSVLTRSPELMPRVSDAIIGAGRTDLAPALLSLGERRVVLDRIWAALMADPVSGQLKAWFELLCADATAVGELLLRAPSIPRALLLQIANTIPPDGVPKISGEDPWLTASAKVSWNRIDDQSVALAAYLFYRALAGRGKDAGKLAGIVLPLLHSATAQNRIENGVWQRLSTRLPKSLFGWDWDRCWRLRAAFVDLLMSGQPPGVLANLEADDELFFALANWARRSPQGESYLWRVADELAATDPGRQHGLKKLLKS